MTFLLALLLPACLGFALLWSLPGMPREAGRFELMACAYPLGIGLTTVQMFFFGLARIPLNLPLLAGTVCLETLCLLLWVYLRRGENSPVPESPVTDLPGESRLRFGAVVETLLLVWIIVKLGTVIYEASLRPVFAFDTFTNWSVRAKLFYYSRSLLLDPSSYDFFGRGVIHSYGNYPPMNPLAQMWMALWAGSFDEVLVKFWTPLFLPCAAAYLYLSVRRDLGRLVALVLVVIFISSPFVAFHATESMSDLPLAVYILFAYGALRNLLRGRLAYLPLVGLFSVLAIFIKGEGTFIAVPLFLAAGYTLVSGSREGRFPFKAVLVPTVAPYLLAVPWFLFRWWYNLGHGADELYATLVFRPLVVVDYLEALFGLQNFNLVFVFVPLALIACGKPDRETMVMVLPIVFYAAFFVALYAIVAYYSDLDRISTAVFRNMLTYFPAACLLLAVLLGKMMRSAEGCLKPVAPVREE